MTDFLHFIDGAFTAGSTGKTFENRRPHDGSLIGHVVEGGATEIDAAVRAAQAAMKGPWGKMGTEERADLMRAIADGITKRFDDFVAAEMADTGQPKNTMEHAFIPRGAANFKAFADIIKGIATESFEMQTPDGKGALNYAIRRPKGVIGVICPWNAPLLLMTWKVAPALACGNAVIVKPSEETPGTATLLGEVMNDVGVPKGVYNVVHGFGPNSAGAALTEHPGVDAITFTGETRTGTAIMQSAAKGLRDVSFELGGKNSAIVFADADMDVTMEAIGRSAFMNCGQALLMESYGATTVYCVDSAGYMLPADVTARIGALKAALQPETEIGFHGHHNLAMGVSNSLAAIAAGASRIDGSAAGFGAGAGNTPLEVFAAVAERMGIVTGVDTFKLMDAAEDKVLPMMAKPPRADRDSLTLGYAGVYSTFLYNAKDCEKRYGLPARDLLMELGRLKMIGGQEDMIEDTALTMAKERGLIGHNSHAAV